MLAVLHTWGGQMQFHPHLHVLICAGGFTPKGQWRALDPRSGYLFARDALAAVFRGRMLEACTTLANEHPEWFSAPPTQLRSLIRRAALKPWGVFVQRSRSDPFRALAYLSRYTHRVAISPSRILQHNDREILIARKKATGCLRLSPQEFLRRFLLHVLPAGFRKIRAYGFLQSGWQKALEAARARRPTSPAPVSSARSCPRCHSFLRYLLVQVSPAPP